MEQKRVKQARDMIGESSKQTLHHGGDSCLSPFLQHRPTSNHQIGREAWNKSQPVRADTKANKNLDQICKSENLSTKNRTKSIVPCGDEWNEKQGLVSGMVGLVSLE